MNRFLKKNALILVITSLCVILVTVVLVKINKKEYFSPEHGQHWGSCDRSSDCDEHEYECRVSDRNTMNRRCLTYGDCVWAAHPDIDNTVPHNNCNPIPDPDTPIPTRAGIRIHDPGWEPPVVSGTRTLITQTTAVRPFSPLSPTLRTITVPPILTSTTMALRTLPTLATTTLATTTVPTAARCTASSNNGNSWCISGCSSISIASGTIIIPNYVFRDCTSLRSITIPNSVTRIEHGAFWGCTSLSSIHIPNSVISIGVWCFLNCTSLRSIRLPQNTQFTSIQGGPGRGVFSNCTSLTSINIPNSVTSIGDEAFYNCINLTSITFEAGSQLGSIGALAFHNCSSLSSVTLPANTVYQTSSFDSRYTTVTLTLSLRLITPQDTPSYGTLMVPTTTTTARCTASSNNGNSWCISGCSSISIASGTIIIPNYVFMRCANLESITIPRTVTSIEHNAFQYCTSLSSIHIPNSVTSIGWSAFMGCNSLTSIRLPQNTHFTSIEGGQGRGVFRSCTSLRSINIPTSVTSIGESAFYRCTDLESITFEAGSRLRSIGEMAFVGCTSLISVTLPTNTVYQRGVGRWGWQSPSFGGNTTVIGGIPRN